jgi:hypothetical protein
VRGRVRSGRVSPAILVLVLVAFAVGAAASLLAGAATASNPGPQHYSELIFPLWEIEAALLVLIFGGVGLLLYVRFAGGSQPLPSRMAVTAVVGILVAILFLIVLQNLGHGGSGFGGGGSGGGSSGGTSPLNATNGTSNASGLPGGGSFLLLGPSTPPWTLFLVVAVVAVVLSVLVTSPVWWRALSHRRSPESPVPSAEAVARVRGALEDATAALDAGGDLRSVVVRLYAAILERVGPAVGDVDGSTPEEIRAIHLIRLGVRPEAAEVLTRSFEEARYSSHLISATAVRRVTVALREATEDLDRAS